jgi:DNA primase
MNLFTHIKSQVSILAVVQEYATLKRAGTYWKGCCPFHDERTASFTVSPHRDIFYCFGCHVSGDVVSFVAKVENMSPKEAAFHLAQRYNITLPDNIQNATQTAHQLSMREQYQKICSLFADFCHEHLLKQPKILAYLEKRGFKRATVEQFRLGYLPTGIKTINTLIGSYKNHDLLAQDIIKAGLIRQQKALFFSPFQDRLLFPIQDHLGRFCGFGGRVIREKDTRAKYYNSSENDFFNKGQILFGLTHAKKSIQKTDEVFLVEGYTDCLAMAQHGYINTVATLGTSCTADHLKILSRYAQRLYIVYDGDSAGQKAVLRITQMCWNANLELFVIQLPTGYDPASYLQKNPEAQLKEQAKDIFVFFVDILGKQATQKSTSQRTELAHKLLETVAKVTDPLKQEMLLQRVSQHLELPITLLKAELNKSKKHTQNQPPNTHDQTQNTEIVNQTVDLESMLEKRLFSVILKNLDLVNVNHDTFYIAYLSEPLRNILNKLLKLRSNRDIIGFDELYEQLDQAEKKCVDRLLVEVDDEPTQQNFEQLVAQFHRRHWRSIVNDVKKRIAHATQTTPSQVTKILQEFEALKKQLLNRGTAE